MANPNLNVTALMLKTGAIPEVFKNNPQVDEIQRIIVAPFVKSDRKKTEKIRDLKEMNGLRKRVIAAHDGYDQAAFKSIKEGKRYIHKFKGGSRVGRCVGWQHKPLIIFDDDEDGKAKPFSANQLVPTTDDDSSSIDENEFL